MAEMNLGTEDGWEDGEDARVRFSQKRAWLICPPALSLMASWKCSWATMSALLDTVA